MNIVKYKKLKNGKYQLLLENGDTMELYEDTILKYELLLTKKIDQNKMGDILKDHENADSYYVALKYLQVRVRSKKEVYDYLSKKKYERDTIENAIAKLTQQGYINDEMFSRSFLNNKLITTSNGPFRIKRDLRNHDIKEEIINRVLEEYTLDIQKEKIEKHINRIVKSNRNKGNVLLRRKLTMDLTTEGFDKSLIEDLLRKLKLEDDQNLAKREYERLYKKLSKKYSGSELEYKIKQKLYQKGFIYEP